MSELVEKLNDRFGTDFTREDMLVVEQLFHDMTNNDDLRSKAQSNSFDRFKHPCEDLFMDILIDRMAQNNGFFERIMDSKDFSDLVKGELFDSVYKWFQSNPTK